MVPSGSKATVAVRRPGEADLTGSAAIKRAPSKTLINKFARSWVLDKTRISLSEGLKINADLNGGDLGALAEMLAKMNVKVDDLVGLKILDIIVTRSGSLMLRCSDGSVYLMSCDFTDFEDTQTFPFALTDFLTGYSGGTGTGKVTFQPDSDICVLVLELSFSRKDKTYKGSLTFVMKPASGVGLKGFTFTPERLSLKTGETRQLQMNANPADGVCTALLQWEVSDSTVVAVSRAGVVTALAAGEATISVNDGKKHAGTCTVTVATP